nr:hypothetical protein Iba_chr02aCG0860 [Ipomoea batatas]GMD15363.1 hypothetical protein Iba_scaffold40931CG0100 [Ipomoea batatas]
MDTWWDCTAREGPRGFDSLVSRTTSNMCPLASQVTGKVTGNTDTFRSLLSPRPATWLDILGLVKPRRLSPANISTSHFFFYLWLLGISIFS